MSEFAHNNDDTLAAFLGYDCGMPKTTHGGARPGSGPKRDDKSTPIETTFLVPMSFAQREKVKELGGAAWVRMQIDAAIVLTPPATSLK